MNKLSIITAVCGQNETTKKWIHTTLEQCSKPHELVIVSNGTPYEEEIELGVMLDELRDKGWSVKRGYNKNPVGTTEAFSLGANKATGDILVMLHNDVTIFTENWDQYIIDFYTSGEYAGANNGEDTIGVCGLVGAKRLGHPDIYKTPYELIQLARYDVWSNLSDAESHGQRMGDKPIEVAVLDGMALIIKKKVYEEIGGFETKYVHHNYDNDLCISAILAGYDNYILPLSSHHNGGITSTRSEYGNWAQENYGGDSEIHKQSHEIFYEKFRNKLPIEIK